MNNLLFFMAISGTIPLFFYYCLRYCLHWHLKSPNQMYMLLKVSLFFYIVPIPLLSNHIRKILRTIAEFLSISDPSTPINGTIRLDTLKYYYITLNGAIHFNKPNKIFIIGLSLWIIICIIALIRIRIRYCQAKLTIKKNAVSLAPYTTEQIIKICKEISLTRQVQILCIDSDFTPFTMGIIRPIIVFPKDMEPETLYPVLLHECIHVKKCDALTKFFSILSILFYWYLPLPYLLAYEINRMAELTCDDKVSQFLNEFELKNYGNIIIKINSASPTLPININLFHSNFKTKSYRITKERLTMLKQKNRKKMIPLTCSFLLAISASTVSAAGYQIPTANHVDKFYETDRIDLWTDPAISEIDFLTDDSEANILSLDMKYFNHVDSYFIKDNGEIIIITEKLSTQIFCNHTYVSAKQRTHTTNPSGGCIVKIYNAKYCTLCGTVIRGDLISTHTYVSCPHK